MGWGKSTHVTYNLRGFIGSERKSQAGGRMGYSGLLESETAGQRENCMRG